MSKNSPNNDIGQTPPEDKSSGDEKASKSFRSLLWVIIVLLIGTIAGIILFLFVASHIIIIGGGPPPPGFIAGILTFLAEHIILSTVSVALLISLVLVYGRIYRQTRANFSLGIFIVLLALLFQAILNYPILELYLVNNLGPTAFSSPLADVFTIVAYAVFLYLSLE